MLGTLRASLGEGAQRGCKPRASLSPPASKKLRWNLYVNHVISNNLYRNPVTPAAVEPAGGIILIAERGAGKAVSIANTEIEVIRLGE
jgi:hypothetical protein